jgi:hypothetical protein
MIPMPHTHNFFTSLLAKEVLPSLALTPKERQALRREALTCMKKIDNVQEGRFSVNKTDSLSFVHLAASDQPIATRKIVVYFLPNYMLWEQLLPEFDIYRQECDADIICCNYRGCGESTGFPVDINTFRNDGIKLVQQLLDQGAKQNNIIFHGYSLGGGVSTDVATAFKKQGLRFNFTNERSFSSMQDVIETSPVWYGRLAAIVLKLYSWTLSPKDDLKSLDDNKIVVIDNECDEVIEPVASFSSSVPDTMKNITRIKMDKTADLEQHGRPWTDGEIARIFSQIKKLWE